MKGRSGAEDSIAPLVGIGPLEQGKGAGKKKSLATGFEECRL
jgi:hypothetical protein